MTTSSNVNPAVNLINSLNGANSSLASSSTSGSTGSSVSGSGLQNSFMTLLTAQLQNQDPLNPMDSGQMTSQLAQISTVDGINQLNATLQALSTSMSSGQSLSSATGLIGHNVLIPGSTIALASSGSTSNGGVQLSQAADAVTVNITDSSGKVIRTMQLGAQSAGVVPFTWDGLTNSGSQAPAGTYNMSVSASMSGQSVTASTLSYGPVTSVTLGSQGPSLNITGLGTAALSSVVMVQ